MANVVKEVGEFNVEVFDNGYALKYSGRDANDDWADAKIVVNSIDELCEQIREVVKIPRS